MWISTCIVGHDDERGRLMRRTIVRYLNLSFVLTLRLMCLPVKKRFPSLAHLVEAGILTEGEKKIIDKMDAAPSTNKHPKYWVPLVWAGSVITRDPIQCSWEGHRDVQGWTKITFPGSVNMF